MTQIRKSALWSAGTVVVPLFVFGTILASVVLRIVGPEMADAGALRVPQESISLAGSAERGNPSARVVILEFSDFQCPFCIGFTAQTLPKILRDYVTPGKVRLAFKNLPLEDLHPLALRAAYTAVCADQQGMFWPTHDVLFQAGSELRDRLDRMGQFVSLSDDALRNCLVKTGPERVRQDLAAARALDIHQTPVFLVGRSTSEGLKVTRAIAGNVSYAEFKTALDAALVRGQ